jgi:hypothetical protein
MVETKSSLSPRETLACFDLIGSSLPEAVERMQEAWRRPVRHNRKIERAALTSTVRIERYCRHLLMGDMGSFLTPPLPDPAKRYDIESAIRTIPSVIPFTRYECESIRDTKWDEAGFYAGVDDDPGITRPELLTRWHEWLWTPKADSGQRTDEPNPEAQALAASYARLSEGMLGALAIWRAELA